MISTPVVLFVGARDAACSQMAAGFLRHLGGDRFEVVTAGTDPAEIVDPLAMEAMNEIDVVIGIDLPQELTEEAVEAAQVVVVMSPAGDIPYFLGTRYEDWVLESLEGQGIETFRRVREELRTRVETLIKSLT